MYSDQDLWSIVNHFRKSAIPRQINELADITKTPNDVLMSYYISDSPDLTVSDFVDSLEHPQELFDALVSLYPLRRSSDSGLPTLGNGVNYRMPTSIIGSALEHKTDKFCLGFEDKLIVATKTKTTYKYPSGLTVDYFSLADEKSANMSILDGGFAFPQERGVYIRETFLTMMGALLMAQRDKPEFLDYSKQIRQFNRYARGIVIAHELGEIDIVRSSGMPRPTLELELASETRAKQFIAENGINPKYYELYHLVRAMQDERGKNVSKIIVDQGFHPLV